MSILFGRPFSPKSYFVYIFFALGMSFWEAIAVYSPSFDTALFRSYQKSTNACNKDIELGELTQLFFENSFEISFWKQYHNSFQY